MQRTITTHVVNGLNEQINVIAMDEPGQGGACHHYRIEPITLPGDHPEGAINPCEIHFQNGPIKERGINGISNEALLAIVRDRLEGFQAGPFACSRNQTALDFVVNAMRVLAERTKERLSRNVEGTHAK